VGDEAILAWAAAVEIQINVADFEIVGPFEHVWILGGTAADGRGFTKRERAIAKCRRRASFVRWFLVKYLASLWLAMGVF
jgi:hypothetical protein